MRKAILILFIFFCHTYLCKGQNAVSINILDITVKGENIELKLEFINNSNGQERIYIPTKQDICYNLLNVFFVDELSQEKSELFPCEGIIDLDSIDISCSNSVLLDSNDSYIRNLQFDFTNLSPYLKKGNKYKVSCILMNEYMKFTGFESI